MHFATSGLVSPSNPVFFFLKPSASVKKRGLKQGALLTGEKRLTSKLEGDNGNGRECTSTMVRGAREAH